MIVLGIETSCDETAISVLRCEQGSKPAIIAELISTQVQLHQAYGGVVPELAAREHLKNLPLLYREAFCSAAVSPGDIDLIAVTQGPGLKGCLLMGLGFAKALSLGLDKPLIGVNHVEAHVLSPFLTTEVSFPYLALVASGGHTELHYVEDLGRYTLIARTSDDAAGEAFDKSAHLLGFPYPGGAILARAADSVTKSSFRLPRVMREAEGFSFSGLKTAVQLLVKKETPPEGMSESLRNDLASAIQEAIVDTLVHKLERAADRTGARSIALVGGVAANGRLRREAERIQGATIFVPAPLHCTDNATMIAYTGALRHERGLGEDILDEGVHARWPIEEETRRAG